MKTVEFIFFTFSDQVFATFPNSNMTLEQCIQFWKVRWWWFKFVVIFWFIAERKHMLYVKRIKCCQEQSKLEKNKRRRRVNSTLNLMCPCHNQTLLKSIENILKKKEINFNFPFSIMSFLQPQNTKCFSSTDKIHIYIYKVHMVL